MIKYNFFPKTAIGGRNENQDSEGSLMTKLGFLCVVCDGMGGAAGGKTASTMAVNIILQEVANSQSINPAQALAFAIKKANQEIFNRGRQQHELRGMGTTATAVIINEEKATVAHAGDSRVYLLRDGENVFRTNDHSKVFELVKRGIFTEEQARLSEESNVIQRALGIAPDIDGEINDNIPFLKDDFFMLCTDGVCGALPEENLLKLLRQEKNVQKLAETVIYQIDSLGRNQGGGHDNLTVSFIQPLFNSNLKVKIDMKTKTLIYSLSTAVAILSLLAGYLFFFGSKTDNVKLESDISSLKQDTTRLGRELRQITKEKEELRDSKVKSSDKTSVTTESSNSNRVMLPKGEEQIIKPIEKSKQKVRTEKKDAKPDKTEANDNIEVKQSKTQVETPKDAVKDTVKEKKN